jgi:cytidylate kinase
MSTSLASLNPSIEQRLTAWEGIRAKLAAVRTRPTVSLSRAFGCEGYLLAERLQGLFEKATGEAWVIHDKALIEAVSKKEGIPEGFLKDLGDASWALENLGLIRSKKQTHDLAFEKVAHHLVHVARTGNAIIVGRGGAIICRDEPNCFHFRLDASLAFRVESVMRGRGLPRREAEALVADSSQKREGFISEHLGARVDDPAHYDAVFNNARHDVTAVAHAIVAYVRAAWPDPHLFRSP